MRHDVVAPCCNDPLVACSSSAWLRVFAIEVFVCPNCGGRRRLLAAIHDPDAIARVLGAMGLSVAAPEMAAARSPLGEAELSW